MSHIAISLQRFIKLGRFAIPVDMTRNKGAGNNATVGDADREECTHWNLGQILKRQFCTANGTLLGVMMRGVETEARRQPVCWV
jgi:hypothetical protein